VLDVPGFWLVMLPFAFPAVIPLAALAAWRPRLLSLPVQMRPLAAAFALVATGSLTTAWLMRSTIENNDLGWRVVLPALLVLPGFAGCLLERVAARRAWLMVPFVVLALLGLPETLTMLHEYRSGIQPGDPAAFVQTAPAWQALRRLSSPADRIANNPELGAAALFWPVNPAWALLADRPSCYAGKQSVVAYGVMTRAQLAAVDERFARVFSGHAMPDDIPTMASLDDCRFALVTAADGAWSANGFASSPDYGLAASGDNWRLYKRVTSK
jgi:hypothetical protein